jgi:hypothetical protein
MPGQLLLLVAVAALCPRQTLAQTCPNKCSRHGVCRSDAALTCACADGWMGADCSQRVCPSASAWVGYASATDNTHAREAECSNVGACDRASGRCSCQPGFAGPACERMVCPGSECSGNGVCASLRQAAQGYDGVRLVQPPTAYDMWDADRIYGCVCDARWTDYACSTALCPLGDDPLTTAGQSPEVQTLTCVCGAACTGRFIVAYGGRRRQVRATAVATVADETGAAGSGAGPGESLEAVLRSLSDGPLIASVAYGGGATAACSGGAGTVAIVTFVRSVGNIAPLALDLGTIASTAATPTVTLTASQEGTTERVPCSGRGTCTAGACVCLSGFGASDGNGGAGDIADCGYVLPAAVLSCPQLTCSGRGTCSGPPEYVCSCHSGYGGPTCGDKLCPKGRAWWDEPSAPDAAHAETVCSNRGICDASTGRCACAAGFTGAACNRLSCPAGDGGQCSSRGVCLSLRELAQQGTFGGATKGNLAVQTLTCSGFVSGTFTLGFRYAVTVSGLLSGEGLEGAAGDIRCLISTTPAHCPCLSVRQASIPTAATALMVKTALEGLSSVGLVDVTISGGGTSVSSGVPGSCGSLAGRYAQAAPAMHQHVHPPPRCALPGVQVCSTGGNTVATTVTFKTELGPQPVLVPAVLAGGGTVTAATTTAGSRPSYGASYTSTSTWDADMIYGCHCDGGPDYNATDAVLGDERAWHGHVCAQREWMSGAGRGLV